MQCICKQSCVIEAIEGSYCERFVLFLRNCTFQASSCHNHEVGIQRRTHF